MTSPELREEINRELKKGYSLKYIRKNMINLGYEPKDIDAILANSRKEEVKIEKIRNIVIGVIIVIFIIIFVVPIIFVTSMVLIFGTEVKYQSEPCINTEEFLCKSTTARSDNLNINLLYIGDDATINSVNFRSIGSKNVFKSVSCSLESNEIRTGDRLNISCKGEPSNNEKIKFSGELDIDRTSQFNRLTEIIKIYITP